VSPRIKRLLPWVLSLAFVAFLFATTDLDAMGDALARADWVHLVVLMAVVTVAAYVADAATLLPLVRRFVAPANFPEILRIKGVSYFLNALNYSLAAGGIAWVLARRHQTPFMRAFSPLVWFFFVDIVALGLLLAFGFAVHRDLIADPELAARVPWVLVVIGAVIVGSLCYWNLRFDFFVFGFFRRWRLFSAFAEARIGDYLRFVPMRMAFIGVYILMHRLLLPAFGVDIPLGALIAYAPLITFVQVIPATVSGLGAAQSVMVVLFAAHVPPEAGDGRAVILAYSTVIGPLMMLFRLIIGYAFVSRVTRDLIPEAAAIEAARNAEND
jgi:hypothetical protein